MKVECGIYDSPLTTESQSVSERDPEHCSLIIHKASDSTPANISRCVERCKRDRQNPGASDAVGKWATVFMIVRHDS